MAKRTAIDGSDGGFTFEIEENGKKYTGKISKAALEDIETANKNLSSNEQFDANENRFIEIARRKIQNGQIEKNGEVRIGTSDIKINKKVGI